MSVKGLGKCAKCFRQINEFTEVRTLTMGDKRSHMVHKSCHPDFQQTENLGSFIPATDVVVSPLVPDGTNYRSTGPEDPPMPTKEQTGRRRKRVE
jgi:hypothetical protein